LRDRIRLSPDPPHRRDGPRRREDAGDDRRDRRLARALPRPDDRLDQRRGHRPHRRDAQQTRHAGRDSIRRLPRHRAFGGHVLWTYTARMVSRAAPALTSIGFRRDIKYFLATYVGLLICIIMILMSSPT